MGKRIYSTTLENEIIIDYSIHEMSAIEIAKKYGYKTSKTVYDILKKHSIPRRENNSKFTGIDEDVLKLIKQGVKRSNISEIFGISNSQIQEIIKRNNTPKRGRLYLSKEEEEQLIRDYLNGLPTGAIRDKFGYKTSNSIYQALKKYSIPRRDQRETRMIGKEYENFSMNKIDNEFKAYFLGLMLSDGWVKNNQIALSMTDEDCIKYVSNFIGKRYTEIAKKGNRKMQYRIVLNNPRLIEELKRFNIVENKTHILKGFELEENEWKFFPYIVRGLIDGDGWIRKDGNEFFICSAAQDFISWLFEKLQTKLFMEQLNCHLGSNEVYYIRSSFYKNINILKSIVYDKPCGMGRKYEKLHGKSSTTTMEQLQMKLMV